MSSDYSGNRKPFVLILRHSGDRETASPVLTSLQKKGLNLCVLDETGKAGNKTERACACVAFLSKNTQNCESLEETLLQAKNAGTAVIPVFLDGTPQSGLIHRTFFSSNALFLENGDTEALAARLMDAEELKHPAVTEAQKKAFRRTLAALLIPAALVLAAAGILIYSKQKPVPPAEQAAASDSSPAEEDIYIPGNSGVTMKDLAKIRTYIFAGDVRITADDNNNDIWAYLLEDRNENNERQWIRKSDGSVVERGTVSDFSYLSYMTNLESLILVNQDATVFPDLSGLKNLYYVDIRDCAFEDLNGLSGCEALQDVRITGDVKDVSGLSGCSKLYNFDASDCPNLKDLGNSVISSLRTLRWSNNGSEDLGFLSACPKLKTLDVSQEGLEDVDALSNCPSLMTLSLGYAMKDISGIRNCKNLMHLHLYGTESIPDFSFLGDLEILADLELNNMYSVKGLDSLKNCRNLTWLNLDCGNPLPMDFSFLSDLPKLSTIGLWGFTCSLSFLSDSEKHIYGDIGFSGRITDYSGLASVQICNKLQCETPFGSSSDALQYLQNANITELCLWNCKEIDCSMIPASCRELSIESCERLTELSGLKSENVRNLRLSQLPRLTALGFSAKDVPSLTGAAITDCPVLTDYGPLYEAPVDSLELQGVPAPDFSGLQLTTSSSLLLDQVSGIEFPDFLSGIHWVEVNKKSFHLYRLDISGLEGIDNLMPMKDSPCRIYELVVSPVLEEQADELKKSRCINQYSLSYPDHRWMEDNDRELKLLSLSELDTLPASLLSRVRRLCLAGDTVVSDESGLHNEWVNGTLSWYLDDDPVKEGTLTDLTKLSVLTGLEELTVCMQPLSSLEGIRGLENLRELEILNCEDLTDYSAMFALSGIRSLRLVGDNFTSLEGIQNFDLLQQLNVSETAVTDLSPLYGCSLPPAGSDEKFRICVPDLAEDLSPLKAVKEFGHLQLTSPSEQMNNERFEEIMSGISFVREVNLCLSNVTDVSCLLDHPELERVELYSMPEAAEKLNSMPHSFELEWFN